ncbi:META domain-containing protein [Pedobacter deserti]|uniref:META domain-containing protein n=1 Tax=Pedobacter deserti TaxID=2817382 RepID=UPI00210E6B6A|nr:META domain-containing protein [Pedobacter sp. SYSU D00382]
MESSDHAHLESMFTKLTMALLVCILAACSSPKKESRAILPADLHGHWNLVSAFPDTVDIKKGTVENRPYLSIDTAKKTIGGYSGCNSFGGEYTLLKHQLTIADLMATQRGCIGSIEPTYFSYLRRVTRYEASQDSLKLYAKDTLLLSFVRQPAPAKQP